MRATVMYGAGDVRVENVPDARLKEPTDALLTITRACICGSDLWPYKTMERTAEGQRMGHEFIGIVEDVFTAAGGAATSTAARARPCGCRRPTGHWSCSRSAGTMPSCPRFSRCPT